LYRLENGSENTRLLGFKQPENNIKKPQKKLTNVKTLKLFPRSLSFFALFCLAVVIFHLYMV